MKTTKKKAAKKLKGIGRQAKLDASKVKQIRAERAKKNPRTVAALATIYGVTVKSIYNVLNNVTWKDV